MWMMYGLPFDIGDNPRTSERSATYGTASAPALSAIQTEIMSISIALSNQLFYQLFYTSINYSITSMSSNNPASLVSRSMSVSVTLDSAEGKAGITSQVDGSTYLSTYQFHCDRFNYY